jgi:hypothetical protein
MSSFWWQGNLPVVYLFTCISRFNATIPEFYISYRKLKEKSFLDLEKKCFINAFISKKDM